jgi:hypothetical protein
MAENERKPYEKPVAKKITPEQAQLLLLDHASAGDQKATELLELIYPEASVKS